MAKVGYSEEHDIHLIEASFAQQYGIRLRHEPDIEYIEYYRLLAGLLPSTPLGRIVQIRLEKDPKIISKWGPYERQIKADWNKFLSQQAMAKANTDEVDRSLQGLQNLLKRLFG